MPAAGGALSWARGGCLSNTNLFIHLFNKNGLSASTGPGPVLRVWDTLVNKGDRASCPWEADILVGRDGRSK